jgi:hypothetical protein
MSSMTGKVARQSGMNRYELKRSHHTKKSEDWQARQRSRRIGRGQMKSGAGKVQS